MNDYQKRPYMMASSSISISGRPSKKLTMESKTDWALLPDDILSLILSKLPSLVDYLRFRVVCRSWCSAGLDQSNQWNHRTVQSRLLHQLPILMFPASNERDMSDCVDIRNGRRILQTVNISETRLIGSAFGWVIELDNGFRISVTNPFLGRRLLGFSLLNVHFCLPLHWNCSFIKGILSSDPTSDLQNCVLIVILGKENQLAIYRPEDRSWTQLDNDLSRFRDIISAGDGRRFYALNQFGQVLLFDAKEKKPRPEFVCSQRLEVVRNMNNHYLVKTHDHRFFRVIQFFGWSDVSGADPPMFSKTRDFQVFELDRDTKQWVETSSLGDQVLFIGGGHSLAVSAADFPGCQPGSIYYTNGDKVLPLNRGYDLGIFHLETRRFQPLCMEFQNSLRRRRSWTRPLWVIPSLVEPSRNVAAST